MSMVSLIILSVSVFFILIEFGLVCIGICYKLGGDENSLLTWIGCIFLCIAVIWFIVFAIMIPGYIGAETKAKIINNQYGTEYTADEVFWAGDTIDKLIRTENDLKDNNQKIELDIK
jgi:hypothetical protein